MDETNLKRLTGAYTSLTSITAKTDWPLSVAEVKKQLEIYDGDTAHDEYLQNMIYAVTQHYEHDTQMKLTSETWKMTLDRLKGDYIELAHRPVNSISYIKYYDSGNTLQTLATSVYALDGATGDVAPGNSRVLLKYNQDWPDLADRWDAVEIRYVTGYGAASAVPQIHKQALLLLATFYFEHRGEPMSTNLRVHTAYDNVMRRFNRPSYP